MVHNSDCLPALREMKDNQFDLAIVDPPYGIKRDDWDSNIPTDEYFSELQRVSKNQIIWGGNYYNLPHTQGWICWDKTFSDDIRNKKLTQGGVPRENMSDFELMWTSFLTKSKFIRYTYIGNLCGFNDNLNVDYKQGKKIHITQKPIELYKYLLKNYAKPNNTILDTHVGSGSSRIACWEMGFDFTGYEIDKDYWDAQEKRFNIVKAQLNIF